MKLIAATAALLVPTTPYAVPPQGPMIVSMAMSARAFVWSILPPASPG